MKHADTKITRRGFLRQSAVVGTGLGLSMALPSVVTRPAFGAAGTEGIRIGIIATGGRGRANLRALIRNVVAVCDVDKSHAATAKADVEKAQNRQCSVFYDYRKLLESKEVDAVVISTPDHWHALACIHACQAGKDVYCEKPLTLVVAEGRAMVNAARRYNRIVQCGSQQRSDKRFRLACELVRNNRIGKIRTVRVGIPGVNFNQPAVPDSEPPPELDYDFWLGPAPYRPYNKNRVHYNFRFFWDYSGGQMTNWGAHHLDIAQWALGMDESGPVEIEGYGRYDAEKRWEVPSWFEVTYTYQDANNKILDNRSGTKVICGMSHRIGATFEGEDGLIYVNRGVIEANSPDILTEPIKDSDLHLYESNDHYKNWFDCMISRKSPICDVEIGHRSATVCHLGSISIRIGRKLKWDPAKEQIVGDPEANRMLSYKYRAPWSLPAV